MESIVGGEQQEEAGWKMKRDGKDESKWVE
jgi:hypothetical protein